MRRRIATIVGGMIVIGAIGLAVGLPIALTHRQDLPFERMYGAFAVSTVSRILAGNATNPRATDRRAVEVGRAAYTGSCGVCHGANGDGRGAFGRATYPDATDLRVATVKEKSDAQLFWIMKNGLAFTAMPAFAEQYTDSDIWALVTYLRVLQNAGASAIPIPSAAATQLALADPRGDRMARGAALYFAQGCHLCHGAEGEAPGDLAIRGRIETEIVRKGDDRGMPAYGRELISDAELKDLEGYLLRFATAASSDDPPLR
jgi:mono/diheme cytochrome c family protein